MKINLEKLLKTLGPQVLPALLQKYGAQYGISITPEALEDLLQQNAGQPGNQGSGYGKYWRDRNLYSDKELRSGLEAVMKHPQFEEISIQFVDLLMYAMEANRIIDEKKDLKGVVDG